jgi:hypothetical protein
MCSLLFEPDFNAWACPFHLWLALFRGLGAIILILFFLVNQTKEDELDPRLLEMRAQLTRVDRDLISIFRPQTHRLSSMKLLFFFRSSHC